MGKSFNLKDALKAGKTPDQMLAEFNKQLAEAQDEIKKEQKKELEAKVKAAHIEKTREEVADAFVKYFEAAELLPQDMTPEDYEKIKTDMLEAIEEIERNFKILLCLKPSKTSNLNKKRSCTEAREGDELADFLLKALF